MSKSFYMDMRGFKELKKFFKKAPKLFQPVCANVLTSYAFETRKYDIKNINESMIVRNQRFIQSSIKVKIAKNQSVQKQHSKVYTVTRARWTGLKEQQYGTPPLRKRSITKHARKGNKRNVVTGRARLKSQNKFWKPEQYSGRSYPAKFYFMMRVLNTRGGINNFILTRNLKTRHGSLGAGMYQIKGRKIKKLQDFERRLTTRRIPWRSRSLVNLSSRNKTTEIWRRSLNHIIRKYKR